MITSSSENKYALMPWNKIARFFLLLLQLGWDRIILSSLSKLPEYNSKTYYRPQKVNLIWVKTAALFFDVNSSKYKTNTAVILWCDIDPVVTKKCGQHMLTSSI